MQKCDANLLVKAYLHKKKSVGTTDLLILVKFPNRGIASAASNPSPALVLLFQPAGQEDIIKAVYGFLT